MMNQKLSKIVMFHPEFNDSFTESASSWEEADVKARTVTDAVGISVRWEKSKFSFQFNTNNPASLGEQAIEQVRLAAGLTARVDSDLTQHVLSDKKDTFERDAQILLVLCDFLRPAMGGSYSVLMDNDTGGVVQQGSFDEVLIRAKLLVESAKSPKVQEKLEKLGLPPANIDLTLYRGPFVDPAVEMLKTHSMPGKAFDWLVPPKNKMRLTSSEKPVIEQGPGVS